jgi:acetolactate synthase I/II/III large subunit
MAEEKRDAMNGATLLLKTAVAGGIEVCFANPGTTETPLVLAFDRVPGLKAVMGLFEGVCTGAADGYGRMKGKPAMTLLHLGPGFANGIANLHNARRAEIPLVNVIGEHATWHRKADAPLAMDIEGLAGTVSGWLRTNESAGALSQDMADAIAASLSGRISSLIVPHDQQLKELGDERVSLPHPLSDPPDPDTIERAAALLRASRKAVLILGGPALLEPGLRLAGRIRALTGCDLVTATFPGRVERGEGLPPLNRIPYFPEEAIPMLSAYDGVVLAGGREPVTFFGYEGIDSYLLRRDLKKVTICSPGQNAPEALACLLQLLETRRTAVTAEEAFEAYNRPEVPHGALTPEKVCLTLAAVQPEGAIIVDEGLTTAFTYYPLTAGLPRHSLMNITGGSIGYGMPCSVGAALACPDRPVINFQADGSALYTVQALWTQAREGLNVTTLICSNRRYHIVKMELERAGAASPGPQAESLTDLSRPVIDWLKIARGFGVPGVSVKTAEALAKELRRALGEAGPHLIEMRL